MVFILSFLLIIMGGNFCASLVQTLFRFSVWRGLGGRVPVWVGAFCGETIEHARYETPERKGVAENHRNQRHTWTCRLFFLVVIDSTTSISATGIPFISPTDRCKVWTIS